MKKLILIGMCLVTPYLMAEPYQTSSEAYPYVCGSKEAAFDAYQRNHARPDSAADLLKSNACMRVKGWPDGTRFRVIQSFRSKNSYASQIEIIGDPPPSSPLYIGGILNDPIDPEEQARQKELAKLPIGCSTPVGGEVRRLERGKDGQLFLKRYMVTSKCVNGQMRSFTKPLD